MELLISVGILAVAILMVVGVFTYLFSASQKSVDVTAGTVIAEAIMQDTVNRFAYDPGFRTTLHNNYSVYASDTVIQSGARAYNGTDFNYTISLQELGALGSSAVNPMFSLGVKCWWWDSGGGYAAANRQGYGRLSVELNRIILYSADY